jgi:hypothetical protein
MDKKVVVYMTPAEKMQYNSYLVKINESQSVFEINMYFRLAKKLLEKAMKRQYGNSGKNF